MDVIVLCAGYATRLYPLTRNKPKALLPVAGKPILEHILTHLEQLTEIDHIYIVTNHKFYTHFRKWSASWKGHVGVQVVNDGTKSNATRLGSIGDMAYVVRRKKISSDLLVIAGDNLFDDDLKRFQKIAQRRKNGISVAVTNVRSKQLARQYGILEANSKGRVRSFLEKPENPPSTLASAGIYYLPKRGLGWLKRFLVLYRKADALGFFIKWLVENHVVYAYTLKGKWFDIGDHKSLKEANQLFKKRQKKSQG